MDEFPHIDPETGAEELSFPNQWRTEAPQEVTRGDDFIPFVNLRPDQNLISFECTEAEFRELLSACYAGAEIVYPEKYLDVIMLLLSGVHSPPEVQEDECNDYPTTALFMDYSPSNPFIDPDFVPDGYLSAPFVINGENGIDIPNYEHNDIIVPIDAITLDNDWFDDLAGQLPTITIRVNGSGTALVKLLNIISGGLAVITVDNPPNLADLIIGIVSGSDNILDLNQDAVSVPPETAKEIDYPIEITGEGEHTIYVVFIPILDDSLIPLRFGGGFRGVNLCDFQEGLAVSCDDIEDCLETSPTIEEINNQITEINNQIIELGDTIEIIDDDGNGNEDVKKPSPLSTNFAGEAYTSAVCQSSYYIADYLIDAIADAWEDFSTITLAEWATKILGLGGFRMEAALEIYFFWQGISNPLLPDDVAAARDKIAEWIFCGELDRDAVLENIYNDSEADSDIKNVVAFYFDALTDDKITQLSYIGSLLTTSEDCSEFCEWTVVWDFTDGSYVPEDENEIVYTGQAWNGEGCVFIDGVGWSGIADIWSIQHTLHRDCRIISMQTNVNKNVPCTAVDVSTTWRDTTGLEPEALGNEQRVLSNSPVTQDWNLYHAEMSEMIIQHNHFLCDPTDAYGSQIHWVKMVGTGAKPAR